MGQRGLRYTINWKFVIIGAALFVILGILFKIAIGGILFSTLISSVVVGYLVNNGYKNGAKNGLTAGFIGGLIYGSLFVLFIATPLSVKTVLISLGLGFFSGIGGAVLSAFGGIIGSLLRNKRDLGMFFPVDGVGIVDRDVCVLVVGLVGIFLVCVSILFDVYILIGSLLLGLIIGYLVFRLRFGVFANLLLGFVCGLIAGILGYFIIIFSLGSFNYSDITFVLVGAVGGVLGVLVGYLGLGSDSCVVWLGEGDALFDAGRFDDAITFYDKVLEEDFENVDALVSIGDALRELGNYEEALECYDEVLDIDSEYAELWFNRGEVLKELKRYDDALNSLNKALKLEPDCKPALKLKKELIQIRK